MNKRSIMSLLTAASLSIACLNSCFVLAADTDSSAETTGSNEFTSPEEITVDQLTQLSTPSNILEKIAGFRIDEDYSGSSEQLVNDVTSYISYLKKDGIIYSNQMSDFSDLGYTHIYYSTTPGDETLYIASDAGAESYPITSAELEEMINASILAYESYDETTIVSAEEKDGQYHLVTESLKDGELYCRNELSIDPETGLLTSVTASYPMEGEEDYVLSQTFTYDENMTIDDSPKTLNAGSADADAEGSEKVQEDAQKDTADNTEDAASAVSDAAAADEAADEEDDRERITFSTVDINGNPVTSEDLKAAKLVMLNYWEPWCGPCVGEMPDLEKLYETYKDQGLLILGVYSTSDMDEDAAAIVSDKGITYPILKSTEDFAKYATSYVPTSFFTDSEGHLLHEDPYVGALDYEGWEEIILTYLNSLE